MLLDELKENVFDVLEYADVVQKKAQHVTYDVYEGFHEWENMHEPFFCMETLATA